MTYFAVKTTTLHILRDDSSMYGNINKNPHDNIITSTSSNTKAVTPQANQIVRLQFVTAKITNV